MDKNEELVEDVAGGPEDYGVETTSVSILSEQIEAAEDNLDACTDRLIEQLENMLELLKSERAKRNEVSK